MSFLGRPELFAALTIAVLAVPAQAAGIESSDIIGTWKLTKVLDYAEITGMDDDEAAQLVGKTLEVRPGGIVLAGEPCPNDSLRQKRVDTVRYIRENYHAAVTHLGLPDNATVVHLNCTEAFFKSKVQIVVFWRGFFFDAAKQWPTKR